MNHLSSVFSDTAAFILFPYHEACDILQEDKRYVTLTTQLYEMRRLQCRLGEQHSVVCYDTYWKSHDMGEATYYRRGITSLELLKTAAIDETRYHLSRIDELS